MYHVFPVPAEDCRNPGVPPGASRSGERFRIGDRVRYLCQLGLDMLGPSERKCLDSKEWSGTEPRCYGQSREPTFYLHNVVGLIQFKHFIYLFIFSPVLI